MTHYAVQTTKRAIIGKKVAAIRSTGIVPATIYGKGIESMSVSLKTQDAEDLYKKAGHSSVVDVSVDGQVYPCLIADLSRHPVSHALLNMQFRKVNLKEKIKAMVPVDLVGQSPAIKENAGVLLTLVNDVEVEALPNDLPEHFEVDISSLLAVDDQITVGELKIPSQVTIITDPEIIIVKIGEKTKEEIAPPPTPEEGAAIPAEGESQEPTPEAEGQPTEKTE